ncbi:MAG: cysteine--tRNA ligase [Planctomycetota bacterium]|nr:cysteine--tRNA ligase [Planctomycetota bacterium]
MSTATAPTTEPTQGQSLMSIRIYNTLTKTKEPFEPITPGKVGIYLCGPTVYKEAHIGHMVGPVIFDTIKRYLTYNGFDVNWVVNITDVDDKLIAQSRQRGIAMSQVATEMTMDYCANLLALGVDQITDMPRATENMDEIIRFIAGLIEKDFAYESGGDVFFDVQSDRQYGKLSNRSADEQQGEGGGAAAKKRSASDFALWKSAKADEPAWDSPWGQGRPGWHIECSAMSRRLLGESFDIHGGGLDLMFPHHENEIAQSECCHGKPMATYWMHNGLLRSGEAGKVGGRSDRDSQASESDEQAASGKMSRSAGAGGLRGQIERHGGEKIRFFLLKTHYRSTVVYSEAALDDTAIALDKFYVFFDRYERIIGRSFYLATDDARQLACRRKDGEVEAAGSELLAEVKACRDAYLARMDDDFNSGGAVSELFNLLGALNKFADQHHLEETSKRSPTDLDTFCRGVETLRELSAILGLFLKPAKNSGSDGNQEAMDKLVQMFIRMRADARKNKDFALSDRIRDNLAAAGITLEDRKEGTTWRLGS